MAKITFQGLEQYERQLSVLWKNSEEVAGKAIYAGAGIVADAIKSGIKSLPVVQGYGTPENPLPGGVTAVGEIQNHPALQRAHQLGNAV